MIKGRRISKLAAELTDGTFAIVSDASIQAGGEGKGPDPHALLESALGACTIITLQMYANRKSIPLESVDVEVKVVSESREETVIERTVKLGGNLSPEERQRLLEIAEKCPIHRLLESRVEIRTTAID